MSEKWKYSVRQHNAVDCFQAIRIVIKVVNVIFDKDYKSMLKETD